MAVTGLTVSSPASACGFGLFRHIPSILWFPPDSFTSSLRKGPSLKTPLDQLFPCGLPLLPFPPTYPPSPPDLAYGSYPDRIPEFPRVPSRSEEKTCIAPILCASRAPRRRRRSRTPRLRCRLQRPADGLGKVVWVGIYFPHGICDRG